MLRAVTARRRARTSVRFFDELLNRTKLGHAMVIASGLVVAMAAIVYMLERHTNPNLTRFSDALWWAIGTATTVRYGDITPQTGLARMFATVLMVMGIGTVGVVAFSVSTALWRRARRSGCSKRRTHTRRWPPGRRFVTRAGRSAARARRADERGILDSEAPRARHARSRQGPGEGFQRDVLSRCSQAPGATFSLELMKHPSAAGAGGAE